MTAYVWRNGELVDKRSAPPLFPRGQRSSAVPMPAFVSDKLWDMKSMADGRLYDSKSELRRSYKEQGFIELGNDAPTDNSPVEKPNVRTELMGAYKAVRGGYKPAVLEAGVVPEE